MSKNNNTEDKKTQELSKEDLFSKNISIRMDSETQKIFTKDGKEVEDINKENDSLDLSNDILNTGFIKGDDSIDLNNSRTDRKGSTSSNTSNDYMNTAFIQYPIDLRKGIRMDSDTEKTFTKDGKEVELNRSVPTLNATVSSGIKNSTTPNNKGNSNDKIR